MSSSSITDRLASLLARTTPFDHLTDAERRGLIGAMTLEIFEPGETILEQGVDIHRALYLVESGLVRLTDVESQRLLDMCGEGAQFGSFGLVQGGVLPYEARAVEPTVCALLAAERFQELYRTDEAFRAHYDDDIKRFVRAGDAGLDASGAYLLFDTSLERLLYRAPVTVPPDATVQDAARALAAADADTLVVVQDGLLMGVVTEGDLVEKVLAAGLAAETPVMGLVERPPITLTGDERLFDAMRVMMRYRIRRVVIVDADSGGHLLGVVSSEDLNHYRGLDPIATTERIERAGSVEELRDIRAESNRRLIRLFQQGVHAEDLFGVIAELDDQLKSRLLTLVERDVRAAAGADAVDLPWAWLSFGTPGRRESTLYARQDNGLVYADPTSEDEATRATAYFARLAEEASAAIETCGFAPTESGLLAREEPFRQPLAAWRAAYETWASAADATATARAANAFDVRTMYGDDDLTQSLADTITAHLQNRRLLAVLMREGTRLSPPLSFFGRFELDRDEGGAEGFDLRQRGLRPVVAMARALALDAGYTRSSNTFERLRHVAGAGGASAGEAKALVGAFTTLADLHILQQMQRAEVGETPGDRVDPAMYNRSQQNLLKEAFKTIARVQETLAARFVPDER